MTKEQEKRLENIEKMQSDLDTKNADALLDAVDKYNEIYKEDITISFLECIVDMLKVSFEKKWKQGKEKQT